MSRTVTLPPTDGAMWRELLASCHPDASGALYQECDRNVRHLFDKLKGAS